MTQKEIDEKIREFLIDEFEIDEDKVSDDALMKEDLALDSLDFVDVVVFVRQTFGFKIDKAEMGEVRTLRQFCDFIGSKVNQ